MARSLQYLAANVIVILFAESDSISGKREHDFEIQERFNVREFAEQFMLDLDLHGSSSIVNIARTSTGFVCGWELYRNLVGSETVQRPTIGNVKRVTFRIDMDSINAPSPDKLVSEIEGMQDLLEEFSPVLGYEIQDESEMLSTYLEGR